MDEGLLALIEQWKWSRTADIDIVDAISMRNQIENDIVDRVFAMYDEEKEQEHIKDLEAKIDHWIYVGREILERMAENRMRATTDYALPEGGLQQLIDHKDRLRPVTTDINLSEDLLKDRIQRQAAEALRNTL